MAGTKVGEYKGVDIYVDQYDHKFAATDDNGDEHKSATYEGIKQVIGGWLIEKPGIEMMELEDRTFYKWDNAGSVTIVEVRMAPRDSKYATPEYVCIDKHGGYTPIERVFYYDAEKQAEWRKLLAEQNQEYEDLKVRQAQARDDFKHTLRPAEVETLREELKKLRKQAKTKAAKEATE